MTISSYLDTTNFTFLKSYYPIFLFSNSSVFYLLRLFLFISLDPRWQIKKSRLLTLLKDFFSRSRRTVGGRQYLEYHCSRLLLTLLLGFFLTKGGQSEGDSASSIIAVGYFQSPSLTPGGQLEAGGTWNIIN